MNELIELGIYIAIGIPAGLFLGACFIYVFNKIPAKWLCDYGEEPCRDLVDKDVDRLKTYPNLYYLQSFFITMWISISVVNENPLYYVVTFIIITWLLMMIAVADAKYAIIPDQFLLFLLLMAGALVPFGNSVKSILIGAVAGAVIMLFVAVVGYFLSKKESLGFGDVKLMMVIGALTGFTGCLIVMVIASMVSGIWFSIALVRKRIKIGEMKPLGPFLCGAAIFYLLCFN